MIHEFDNIVSELLSVAGAGSNVAEYWLRQGTVVCRKKLRSVSKSLNTT
jgi:hypothetical protein